MKSEVEDIECFIVSDDAFAKMEEDNLIECNLMKIPTISVSSWQNRVLSSDLVSHNIIIATSDIANTRQMKHLLLLDLADKNVSINIFPMINYCKSNDKWQIKQQRLLYLAEEKVLYFYSELEAKLTNQFIDLMLNRYVYDEKNFMNLMTNLISGLDHCSIRIILNTLDTVYAYSTGRYRNYVNDYIPITQPSEQVELLILKDKFYSDIKQINSKLFAYKDYLLPCNQFDSLVFYYKYGLEHIDTLHSLKEWTGQCGTPKKPTV